MRIITINNIEVTIIAEKSLKPRNTKRRDGSFKGKTILCVVCNKPKFIRNEDLETGRSLAHLGCSNKIKFRFKHNDPELSRNIVLDNIINKLRHQAKRRKIKLLLTREQVADLVFENCCYCNQEPNQLYYEYKIKYNGIDRVNNNLDYSVDNCVPCCINCNRAKANLTLEEFTDWVSRVSMALTNNWAPFNDNKEKGPINLEGMRDYIL